MGYQECWESSDSDKAWALIEFLSWCCASEGNLTNTISEKIAAVQYFHRLPVGVELLVTAPVVQCAHRYCTFPCGGGNATLRPPTDLFRHSSLGRNSHPLMEPGGEGFVAVFMSELFSDGAVGRDARLRFGEVHSLHRLTRGDLAFYANWKACDGYRPTM